MPQFTDLELLRRFIGGLLGSTPKAAKDHEVLGDARSDSDLQLRDYSPY